MPTGPLLDRMRERVLLDSQEGDIAYFNALTLELEYLTKLVTAGVLACILDDPDRHRYSLEHRIVRADSLGEWVDALNAALTGPASQCFMPASSAVSRQLTERVGDGDWRYGAIQALQTAATGFGVELQVGAKAALRQGFQLIAQVRNRTRGHGATTAKQCSEACGALAAAARLLVEHLEIFSLPWVHLHRNMSGKYRVAPLLGACVEFEYLKSTREVSLPNGAYLFLNKPVEIPFIFSDTDVTNLFLPNGNFKNGSFEALSYVTNDTVRRDGAPWSIPPGPLPPSETEGRSALEKIGNTFGNVPPMPVGYVPRRRLELKLKEELERNDRHPIVSLTGPGGIGKTTLALAAIEALCQQPDCPYLVVLWMSARDIDLLDSGPKPVAPRVVKKREFARAAVSLLEPAERANASFDPEAFFQNALAKGAAGTTLFVVDNFETVESPADLFAWLDLHVRLPNKLLITTRSREFNGDYPIEIGGMTDEEAHELIERHSKRLGINTLLEPSYIDELIRESDGHPYVIKILLGQVAKEQRAVSPERIVASADHLLAALFERTFEKLSPAGRRVFLLLSSWRVFVPAVAVEAVTLRPGNERFDVAAALAELKRFSLVEEIDSASDGEVFVGVPLAAATYGRKKLDASPLKVAVEEDRKLLMEFGAGKREDAHKGVLPRIERLIRTAAARAAANPGSLESLRPVLEYLASRVPAAYELLATLAIEDGVEPSSKERAQRYLRSYLEATDAPNKKRVWLALADVCRSAGDVVGEVHALAESALISSSLPEELSSVANQINNRIYELKGLKVEDVWSPEVRLLIERVATALERHLVRLTATDCSRLAWLHLNVKNDARAFDIARSGLLKDPKNEYCLNLLARLHR